MSQDKKKTLDKGNLEIHVQSPPKIWYMFLSFFIQKALHVVLLVLPVRREGESERKERDRDAGTACWDKGQIFTQRPDRCEHGL